MKSEGMMKIVQLVGTAIAGLFSCLLAIVGIKNTVKEENKKKK